jgi:hypothetical protein
MQHLLPKFAAKFLHIFTQSLKKVTVACRIDCFGLPGQILVRNPSYVKETDEHSLDFAVQLCHLFPVLVSLAFHVQLMLSSVNACLITAMVSVRFAQNVMLFLRWIHPEIASSKTHDFEKQKDVTNQHVNQLNEILYTDS